MAPAVRAALFATGLALCASEGVIDPRLKQLPAGALTCANQAQSPIDVVEQAVGQVGTGKFLAKTSWVPAVGIELTNNGHYLGFESDVMGYVTVTGRNGFPKYYQVSSVALQVPSEHLLNGRQFPMELQVVHKNQLSVLEVDEKDVLVTSIMFDVGPESRLMKQLLPQTLPAAGSSVPIDYAVDLMWALGPALDGHFYKYNGTFTSSSAPGCVQWVVFENVMTMSAAQLQALQGVSSASNAQPAQQPVLGSIARDDLDEGSPAEFKYFIGRDSGANDEKANIYKIIAPCTGTLAICVAVMCSVFVREDGRRKVESAGGLERIVTHSSIGSAYGQRQSYNSGV